MKTRDEILSKAAEDCLKEFYEYAIPKVNWEDFLEENKTYTKKYQEWKKLENRPPIKEYCGPRPYEFYYLPSDIVKDIVLYYVHVYRMDHQQELLDTIEILKNYCKEPIVDKYIDDWTDETGFHHPGFRSYDHPDNLEKEITKILGPEAEDNPYHVHKICDKFFEFLDMAGNFYNWNRELNSFNTTVYFGPSPNSNKQAVIDNWKQYRNKDIEIDEKQIKEDYYGEELD
jgi:hypothetical protein